MHILSNQQKKVFDINDDLLIHGTAGTGKTLLLIELAKIQNKRGKVLIVTFTRALCSFIHSNLGKEYSNISVIYSYKEWNTDTKFDFILIDEGQDFSKSDLLKLKSKTVKQFYVFGDNEQQLYHKNLRDEENVDLIKFAKEYKLRKYNLTKNYRNIGNLSFLVSRLFDKKSYNLGEKQDVKNFILKQLPSVEEEVTYIANFIKSYEGSIGILMGMNEELKMTGSANSIVNKKLSIKELSEKLSEKGVPNGMLYNTKNRTSINTLDFNNHQVNIMTYHSSKGLEFDCVILPFLFTHSLYFVDENPLFVAMTRSKKELLFTYHGHADIFFAPMKEQKVLRDKINVSELIFPEYIEKNIVEKNTSQQHEKSTSLKSIATKKFDLSSLETFILDLKDKNPSIPDEVIEYLAKSIFNEK